MKKFTTAFESPTRFGYYPLSLGLVISKQVGNVQLYLERRYLDINGNLLEILTTPIDNALKGSYVRFHIDDLHLVDAVDCQVVVTDENNQMQSAGTRIPAYVPPAVTAEKKFQSVFEQPTLFGSHRGDLSICIDTSLMGTQLYFTIKYYDSQNRVVFTRSDAIPQAFYGTQVRFPLNYPYPVDAVFMRCYIGDINENSSGPPVEPPITTKAPATTPAFTTRAFTTTPPPGTTPIPNTPAPTTPGSTTTPTPVTTQSPTTTPPASTTEPPVTPIPPTDPVGIDCEDYIIVYNKQGEAIAVTLFQLRDILNNLACTTRPVTTMGPTTTPIPTTPGPTTTPAPPTTPPVPEYEAVSFDCVQIADIEFEGVGWECVEASTVEYEGYGMQCIPAADDPAQYLRWRPRNQHCEKV